jgi:starch phosphorylase
MEVGLDNFPTYSGGLGILAGDLAYSFSDLGIPASFVTLLARNGYTSQRLDTASGQLDSPQPWDWQTRLARTPAVVEVEIGDRSQKVGAREYMISGKSETSILFLDTDYPENDPEVRDATDRLYGGGPSTRLIQDIVLGVGGYRILKALGRRVQVYHLNESHAAFATVELLREHERIEEVRTKCVFTTHTPVPAGNDVFPVSSVREAFRRDPWMNWDAESFDGAISLSRLASKYSGVTNAVSMKHKFVSNGVIGHDGVAFVTNGAYHRRWVHPELKALYNKHLPGWEDSPSLLARAGAIPSVELEGAHRVVKTALVRTVRDRTGIAFSEDRLTLTVAKRFTGYKRNGMILSDPARLARIASEKGELQIIVAGKAHPMDAPAKGMILDVIRKGAELNNDQGKVKVVFLENYDIEMAKLLVAGSDVWLNNPRRPMEACGTSGMKAGMNGVLNLSVYDGWWLEGGVEGVNGWGIGRRSEWRDTSSPSDGEDENDLYVKLAEAVIPLYYGHRERWSEMAKSSIATAGSLFNSYRMVEDYMTKVYAVAAAIK